MVGFGIAGKLALLNLFFVVSECLERIGFEVRVRFNEFRHKVIEEPEKIVEDQYLTVTVRTGADPDGGD